ncbi:MAG: TonB-dependent receptor [Gammaproteobacteria bacterium]|nr:TonB-dependent receptor [Gammaproteobacteria bacterium]
MPHRKILLSAAALAAAIPATALPEDPGELALDRIVVEGFRLDQTLPEVGSSVTVITAEDIEALGFGFAVDVLAAAPGVTINSNGSFGGVASMRIRGAGSEQTLVLVDGVPVNDPTAPGGGFNLARLDAANIERIEVLKGPQSTFWGTDAIGGVVSITTKRQEEPFEASAFGEYGSFTTFRGGSSVGYANSRGDFRLGLTGTETDGISKADRRNRNPEEDPYSSRAIYSRGGWHLGADTRLDASLQWSTADTAFDSYSADAQGNVADGDEDDETRELTGNVRLSWPLFGGQLENVASVGHAEIERRSLAGGLTTFAADGKRRIYRYQGTLAVNARNALAFGLEREETMANGDEASSDGYFALYELKPVEPLVLTAGWRVDEHGRFGSQSAGRLAAAWSATDSVTLRASWGQGFKAPTIFQTTYFCCGAIAPNSGLRAETSESFDAGVEWRAVDDRARLAVTYFDQRTRDQIDFSFALGGYKNIAEVDSRGVEIAGSYRLNDWLALTVDYAYIDARRGTGEPLARLPKHSGDLAARFDPDGPFSGTVLLRHNGTERAGSDVSLAGWTRLDLVGAYGLTDNVELFGRIENLLDHDYQQVLGYGTPGLSGSLGLRLRY